MENLEGGEVKWRSREHGGPVLELSQIQRIMKDVTLGLEYRAFFHVLEDTLNL